MQEAREYYNTHYKGRLKFAKIYDYSIDDVKRLLEKWLNKVSITACMILLNPKILHQQQ